MYSYLNSSLTTDLNVATRPVTTKTNAIAHLPGRNIHTTAVAAAQSATTSTTTKKTPHELSSSATWTRTRATPS